MFSTATCAIEHIVSSLAIAAAVVRTRFAAAATVSRIELNISYSSFDKKYGARPLKRAIQSRVEDLLADEMLKNNIKAGDKVTIDTKDDEIIVKINE